MIAFDNMSVSLGQLVSYGLGAVLTDVPHGWRYMVAIGGVPPMVLAALLPLCPESPRQLITRGNMAEACKVIARVYPHATAEQVAGKADYILRAAQEESVGKSLWWQFKQLHCVPGNLRALVAACTVMASKPLMSSPLSRTGLMSGPPVSQLGGFNTLMYYSGTLFGLVGFNKPTVVSLVVGGTNFVFTLFNMLIIDKVGRRAILIATVIGMASVSTTPSSPRGRS